jgi:hypothetical protein
MARRLLNVERYEHHFFRGWRVTLKRQGRRYIRYFRDLSTPRESLTRAVQWRDEMRQRLPPPRKFHLRQKPTRTGVVGVSYVVDRTRSGRHAPRYVAMWHDAHGRRLKRSFSVRKHGKDRARALAVQCRKQAIARMLRPRGGLG